MAGPGQEQHVRGSQMASAAFCQLPQSEAHSLWGQTALVQIPVLSLIVCEPGKVTNLSKPLKKICKMGHTKMVFVVGLCED